MSFVHVHCLSGKISTCDLTIISFFVWSGGTNLFFTTAPLIVVKYYMSINCDQAITENKEINGKRKCTILHTLSCNFNYIPVFIYLNLISAQCPYLFYLSCVTSGPFLSQAWFRFTNVSLFVLVSVLLTAVSSGPAWLDISLPALIYSNLNWIETPRTLNQCQSIQTSPLALYKQERDTEGYGGIHRETNEGNRGRSEELQQLCDSGKGNE